MARQLEPEIRWKAALIALDLLVETACTYAVKRRQIGIKQDLLSANQEDSRRNPLDRHKSTGLRCGERAILFEQWLIVKMGIMFLRSQIATSKNRSKDRPLQQG